MKCVNCNIDVKAGYNHPSKGWFCVECYEIKKAHIKIKNSNEQIMKKYFIHFINGTQCKNKAQTEAYKFIKSYDGTLVHSTAELLIISEGIKNGISAINAKFPRCQDVNVSQYSDHNTEKFCLIYVGDNLCRLHIYEVIQERGKI